MLNSKKSKKHMVTLACLVVGMLVLTTSVYANFDDAKGYSNFKEALKKLAFEETDFTADMNMTLTLDGEVTMKSHNQMKLSDGNSSSLAKYSYEKEDDWNVYNYSTGNKYYSYYQENNTYFENERTRIDKTMIPLEDATGMSGSSSKKAIRFMELLADTMIGDLKNNVVLDSVDENGVRNYSLNIEGSQIPEVVNAGLSMVFSTSAGSYGDENSDDIAQMYASDARIGSAKCTFSMDKEGRLIGTYMEATLVGEDLKGNSHKSALTMEASISDYGTTLPEVFDPAGKVKAEDRPMAETYSIEETSEE